MLDCCYKGPVIDIEETFKKTIESSNTKKKQNYSSIDNPVTLETRSDSNLSCVGNLNETTNLDRKKKKKKKTKGTSEDHLKECENVTVQIEKKNEEQIETDGMIYYVLICDISSMNDLMIH